MVGFHNATKNDATVSNWWSDGANEIAFSIGMIIGGALLAIWGGLKNRVAMMVVSTVVFGALSVAAMFVAWSSKAAA